MKIKFITTASDPNNPGLIQLERSLKYFGWDYKIVIDEYLGFGSKLLGVYNYLKTNEANDLELFIYGDSYDSFILSGPDEIIEKYKPYHNKILFSAELSCWPHKYLEAEYPECETPFRFLNGGGWICSPKDYINLIDMEPFSFDVNDQERHTNFFLNRNNEAKIILDTKASVFQAMGHTKDSDFKYDKKRLINTITGESPCLIHGNGRTPLEKVYKLL